MWLIHSRIRINVLGGLGAKMEWWRLIKKDMLCCVKAVEKWNETSQIIMYFVKLVW